MVISNRVPKITQNQIIFEMVFSSLVVLGTDITVWKTCEHFATGIGA